MFLPRKTAALLALGGAFSAFFLIRAVHAASPQGPGYSSPPDVNAMDIEVDRGAAGLSRYLAALGTRASILMVTAHPDDEDGGMLAYQTRGLGARGTLLTLNRGEGGQNAMSVDTYDALGLMRTQELLAAGRYYGVAQYWTRVIDYGFSKTREEALEKWGYDRVLADVVRVVRMTRPLVLTAVFIGAATDGHGNHQVSGEMAQDAFVAAGDPNRFPEQMKEGLRPWKPLKVYARAPFFNATKEGIYDYATDKYVPVRFHNYVDDKWIEGKPPVNVSIPEGKPNYAAGLTFLQIGRQGLGNQKTQNGGVTIPPAAISTSDYHRYGSRVPANEKETSFYDGIDISLTGIAGLATGDTSSLKAGLAGISKLTKAAAASYRYDNPAGIAPTLADGLKATRELLRQVSNGSLAEPGKSDVIYELQVKEQQFEKALVLALGLSFEAVVAPEKSPEGPMRGFGGPPPTFTIAIPGQTFGVQTHLLNASPESLDVENISVAASDGKAWQIKPQSSPAPKLAGEKDLALKFSVIAPQDAALTRPYFSRPDDEQPYYNLVDERYRNLSFSPYPLAATAKLIYRGNELQIEKVVQSMERVEGIGNLFQPLLMGPAISVAISPGAGAVPLNSKSFVFSCTLHSNVKGPAGGVLRLSLPSGWESAPASYPFSMKRDGETEMVTFQITPHSIQTVPYEIKAVVEFSGKTYDEGYTMTGYPGLRPYPYYRPAVYKAVGVEVKTAPALRIGFLPGTGDDVPRAMEDLGLKVNVLTLSDIASGKLAEYDAIVLGVRAYMQSGVRAANARLLEYVKNGGTLVVQYNVQNFDKDYGPYPFSLGSNPSKVVDEGSAVSMLDPGNPILNWPNKVTATDFAGWDEERGHGFMEKWDSHYTPLVETHDPDQSPQKGGLLLAHYGKGVYIYAAFALYRQLPSGVPGAYRILANLVSAGKNPEWK